MGGKAQSIFVSFDALVVLLVVIIRVAQVVVGVRPGCRVRSPLNGFLILAYGLLKAVLLVDGVKYGRYLPKPCIFCNSPKIYSL